MTITGLHKESDSPGSARRAFLKSPRARAGLTRQICCGLRGSTHQVFRSSWIDREVWCGSVVGAGEGRDRSVVGDGVAEPVDWSADRSAPSDGLGSSRRGCVGRWCRSRFVRRCGCRCVNGRRSRGVWLRVSLGVRSHGGWVGRRRRSCGRSHATVMCVGIGPARLIELHWVELVARRCRSWRRVRGCERWSNRSSSCGGRRNRSRVGWWKSSPTIRRCACLTRRSICRCSCSPAARYARN